MKLTGEQQRVHAVAFGIALFAIAIRNQTLTLKGDSLRAEVMTEASKLADAFVGALPKDTK